MCKLSCFGIDAFDLWNGYLRVRVFRFFFLSGSWCFFFFFFYFCFLVKEWELGCQVVIVVSVCD